MRAQFFAQAYQHVPAVLTTLAAGASAIRTEREGGGLALAAVELGVGAWVLATIAQEARHVFGRAHAHVAGHAAHDHGLHTDPALAPDGAWIDVPGLAAAALGYVEVWHHAHERGYFKLVSPYMLGATATLFIALGGKRLIRRRMRSRMAPRRPHLAVTPEAVSYRGGRWRRWSASWDDVAGVDHAPGELVVQLRDGRRHVLRADDHLSGDGMIDAARAAVARHAPPHIPGAQAPVTLSHS